MRYFLVVELPVFDHSDAAGKNRWAKWQRYTWFGIAAVCIYVAGVVALRWFSNRSIDREIERKASAQQAEEDRRTVEAMGGNRFEILAFYASPPEIRRGERSQLCYGVSNAATLSVAPELGSLRPSYSRCVDVSPRKDATYTLTATDASGHTLTATAAVRVR